MVSMLAVTKDTRKGGALLHFALRYDSWRGVCPSREAGTFSKTHKMLCKLVASLD